VTGDGAGRRDGDRLADRSRRAGPPADESRPAPLFRAPRSSASGDEELRHPCVLYGAVGAAPRDLLTLLSVRAGRRSSANGRRRRSVEVGTRPGAVARVVDGGGSSRGGSRTGGARSVRGRSDRAALPSRASCRRSGTRFWLGRDASSREELVTSFTPRPPERRPVDLVHDGWTTADGPREGLAQDEAWLWQRALGRVPSNSTPVTIVRPRSTSPPSRVARRGDDVDLVSPRRTTCSWRGS